MRRIQRLARRSRVLELARPALACDAKAIWQADPGWQPLREAVERLLIAYDWGEALVGLNLCLKPLIDQLVTKQLALVADGQGDCLLREMLFSFDEDCQWQRAWTSALVSTALKDSPRNREPLSTWVRAWMPLATRAAEGLAGSLGQPTGALSDELRAWHAAFLRGLGLDVEQDRLGDGGAGGDDD